MTTVTYKKKGYTEIHTQTQGRRPCEEGGRDWNFAATSQGTPVASEAEKGKKGVSSRGFGRIMALPTPHFQISDL